jgi:methionyl-tRNA formyltransferase
VRIVFFGTPDFAVPSLEVLIASPHEVVAVVTQPDRPRGRGQQVSASPIKSRAEAAGLPVLQPDRLKDPSFLDPLRALASDLGVVAAYGRILPQVLLDLPRLGMVNVHASLLPRHRGASPIARAILDGDARTGVTIMRVVQALDAGPMLAVRETAIQPDETAEALEARLATLGAVLLAEMLEPLARGTQIETAQDEALATYAPRIVKPDGLIEWDQRALAVHNRVRALVPWPHAYTFLDGQRLVLHETHPYDSIDAARLATGGEGSALVQPGVVLASARGVLLVGAAEGTVLEIRRLQQEGRRVLTAREFLAGHPLAPGTGFSPGPS